MSFKILFVLTFILFVASSSFAFAESDSVPSKLKIILPSDSVKIKEMPVFVVLNDNYDNPILAENDISIEVRTFGNIHAQTSKIIIQKGMHYSVFQVSLTGDGGVAIASSGLDSDMKNINFEAQENIPELRVRVAPNPIPPSSFAQVYVWLEQDDKPFIPKNDVSIKLVSEDDDFLTFSKNSQFNSNPTTETLTSSTTILLKAGESFVKTKVFSTDFISEFNPSFGPDLRHKELDENEGNEFTITALADGFDGKQTDIIIQPAKMKKSIENVSDEVSSDPTITKVWAYPNTVFEDFEIIVAVYTQTKEPDRAVIVGDESQTTSDREQLTGIIDQELDSDDEQNDQNLSNSCDFCAPLIITDSDIRAHVSTNELVTPTKNSVIVSSSSFTLQPNYVVIPAKSNGILGDAKISAVFDGTLGDEFDVQIQQPFDPKLKLGITSIPALDQQNQDLMMVYGLENGIISNIEIENLVISTKPALDVQIYDNSTPIKIIKGFTGHFSGSINVMALADGLIPVTTTFEIISEPITLDLSPLSNEMDFGNSVELYYKVIPSYAHVSLDTILPFDEIDNGFRVYGTTAGTHTLSLTAKNGGDKTANKQILINVNFVEPPIESIIANQNAQDNQISANFNFFDISHIYFIIVGIGIISGIIITGIIIKKKFKSKSKNSFEEVDLTF